MFECAVKCLVLCIICMTSLIFKGLVLGKSLQHSLIFKRNQNYTGFGTIIGNFTPNSKISKFVSVNDALKQRVLMHFFKAENMSDKDIQTRFILRFGRNALNVKSIETTEELKRRRNLHYNIVERVIIQFLSAEGVRPSTIYKRLRNVSKHGQHMCNVYRWAHKFRGGRTNVGNLANAHNGSRTRRKSKLLNKTV